MKKKNQNITDNFDVFVTELTRALFAMRLMQLAAPDAGDVPDEAFLDAATAKHLRRCACAAKSTVESLLDKVRSKRGWASQHVRDVVLNGVGGVEEVEELDVQLGQLVELFVKLTKYVEMSANKINEIDKYGARALLAVNAGEQSSVLWAWQIEDADPLLASESNPDDDDDHDDDHDDDGDDGDGLRRGALTRRCSPGKCERGHADPLDCDVFFACDGSRASCVGQMPAHEAARGDFPPAAVDSWAVNEARHGRR